MFRVCRLPSPLLVLVSLPRLSFRPSSSAALRFCGVTGKGGGVLRDRGLLLSAPVQQCSASMLMLDVLVYSSVQSVVPRSGSHCAVPFLCISRPLVLFLPLSLCAQIPASVAPSSVQAPYCAFPLHSPCCALVARGH